MTNRRKLVKQLRYRDLSGASQEAHQNHWRNFQWQSGPIQVRCVGPWGSPQVWASSEAEGRRVLQHAASIAGWDLSPDGPAEWEVAQISDERVGRTGTFRPQVKRGILMVSKRNGPSGAPEV